jgi:hypothetical protein
MHLRMVIRTCGLAWAMAFLCTPIFAEFGVTVSGKARIIDPPDSAKLNKLESSKYQIWYEGSQKLTEDICVDQVVDPDLQCSDGGSWRTDKSSKTGKNSKQDRDSRNSRNSRSNKSRSCYNPCYEDQPQCGKIEEGTCVSSYLIHFDPNEKWSNPTACFTFDKEILGLAFKSDTLSDTDFLGAPGTCYPTGSSIRGIEFLDFFKITNGGYTLELSFLAKWGFDQIRVFTAGCCDDDGNPSTGLPEPASMMIWSLALVGGGLAERRRRNRQTGAIRKGPSVTPGGSERIA